MLNAKNPTLCLDRALSLLAVLSSVASGVLKLLAHATPFPPSASRNPQYVPPFAFECSESTSDSPARYPAASNARPSPSRSKSSSPNVRDRHFHRSGLLGVWLAVGIHEQGSSRKTAD